MTSLFVDDEGAERSLSVHSRLRRDPHRVLRRLLDRLPPGTPAEGPDGPVARLEATVAELLGMPAARFFPTGTMAQQVALRIHAEARGRTAVAFHPQCHLAVHEADGYAIVHGLRAHLLGERHRLANPADLDPVAEPLAAVLLELPQRDLGGQLPTWPGLREMTDHARARGAAVHLDGARLWEAQPFYDRPHAEIAGLFDTVYVSLYKALEGVRGALLAGDEPFIAQAELWRTRLGGAIHNAWPLAAIAAIGLDELVPRMPAFWRHAQEIAAAVRTVPGVVVVPDPPQTPLFHIHLPAGPVAVAEAARQLVHDRRVHLLLAPRSAPRPDTSYFEVTVGENAMEFTPTEVAELVGELLDRTTRRRDLSDH